MSARGTRVFRPSEYSVTPTFTQVVAESCTNRYRMKVDALSADAQRMSFSWKAPGLSLLLSPQAFIECQFDVQIADNVVGFRAQTGTVLQRKVGVQNNDGAAQQAAGTAFMAAAAGVNTRLDDQALIAFGQGDCFSQALTSYQLVFNGAAMSQVRQNEYKGTLDRCWISQDAFRRRFSQAGGEYSSWDGVAVSGASLIAGTQTGAADTPVIGQTQDSALRRRMINFLNAISAAPATEAADGSDRRTITVRWPINGCGIFCPYAASDGIANSCPYNQSSLAIPHANIMSLDLLFKDLEQCVIRNLSQAETVTCTMIPGKTQLHLEYLRLGPHRANTGNVELATFRVAVHDTTGEISYGALAQGSMNLPAGTLRGTAIAKSLKVTGTAREQTGNGAQGPWEAIHRCTAEFSGITTSQVPSYICVMFQKSTDLYSLAPQVVANQRNWGGGAGENSGGAKANFIARNTLSSASIEQFELEIMSSIGAYKFGGDSFPYLRTKQELYRDHLRSCVSDYADYDTWQRHCCCLLIRESDFARGLASSGSAYPLQISAKVEFANRREFVDGTDYTRGGQDGVNVIQDSIAGKPVMLMVYDKQFLLCNPSSAILTSMNESHSQAQAFIQRPLK